MQLCLFVLAFQRGFRLRAASRDILCVSIGDVWMLCGIKWRAGNVYAKIKIGYLNDWGYPDELCT